MANRLPQANLDNKYTDSQLIARAQQVHDGMTANAVIFPTPPTSMVNLQAAIDNYAAAAAAAIKGSKAQTSDKNINKTSLIHILKGLAIYVTQVSQSTGTSFPIDTLAIKNKILLAGFALSKDPAPVESNQGIKPPYIRKAISQEPGKLKILIRQYTDPNRNTKLYEVQYRTSAVGVTPAGPWVNQTFTGQNQILLEGLDSGVSYDYKIASIAGRDTKRNVDKPLNFTPTFSIVII